jgi:hypothetical protein
MDTVHTEIHNGYKIEIHYDTDPCNPRTDWDHETTMVCFHSRYNLGDEQFKTADECRAAVYPKGSFSLPLYLYDHSGITMNTTGFSCPWDSGLVGWIFITQEKAAEVWPRREDETHNKWATRCREYLDGAVQEYNNYLTGNVYGYKVFEPLVPNADPDDEDDWDEIDSCWGFYGDYDSEDGCLAQARDCTPDKPKEFGELFVMAFQPDGTVEFTRSPKLYAFFNGRGEMERISEIKKGDAGYYIFWLKGPLGGHAHTGSHDVDIGIAANDPGTRFFPTYELAVEHEVAVLNAMRKQGVSFA